MENNVILEREVFSQMGWAHGDKAVDRSILEKELAKRFNSTEEQASNTISYMIKQGQLNSNNCMLSIPAQQTSGNEEEISSRCTLADLLSEKDLEFWNKWAEKKGEDSAEKIDVEVYFYEDGEINFYYMLPGTQEWVEEPNFSIKRKINWEWVTAQATVLAINRGIIPDRWLQDHEISKLFCIDYNDTKSRALVEYTIAKYLEKRL
jgi:hypothetical protein